MFGRRKASPPPPPVGITVDVTCGDAGAALLHSAFAASLWDDVFTVLGSADDPHRRAFLINQIAPIARSRGEDRPSDLDRLVDSRPDDPAPRLLRGTYGVTWAWNARGAGYASTVSEDAFTTFFERLRGAEDDLMEAARLDPEDPRPWAQLLTSGRGLQVGLEEIVARFEQAQKRAPGLYETHTQLLQSLCAKWYGSDAEMFSFARTASTGAPPGSPLHALVAIAHYEKLHTKGWTTAERNAYLAADEPKAELDLAGRRAMATNDLDATPQGRRARDILAYVCGLFAVDTVASKLFSSTGNVITPGHWAEWGGWPRNYERTRARVFARSS